MLHLEREFVESSQEKSSSDLSKTPEIKTKNESTPVTLMTEIKKDSLARKIDHTLLKPDATYEEIRIICEEGREHGFAGVCVNSSHVRLAADLLKDSATQPIAVIGFPFGAMATPAKAFEAHQAILAGAREIDMVINLGALKSREYTEVFKDIYEVVQASKPYPVKVILETSSLNEDQKIIACCLSKAAGAAFVKTSTGFGSGGATREDVLLMRRIVGPNMGIKASGGIKDYKKAKEMICAGANRIGTSASITILKEAPLHEDETHEAP